jgi:hypothetical protein
MAPSEKQRRNERAHFPPGIDSGEMTGRLLGRKTSLDSRRLSNKQGAVQRQEGRDRLLQIGRLDVPIHDRAVAKARPAALP